MILLNGVELLIDFEILGSVRGEEIKSGVSWKVKLDKIRVCLGRSLLNQGNIDFAMVRTLFIYAYMYICIYHSNTEEKI